MNNPCENKSYRAKIKACLELDGLEFSCYEKFEFEVPGYFNSGIGEIEEEAKRQFISNHKNTFLDLDISIVVIDVNKF